MTKSELIQRIAELNPHLYHRDVERIVSTILEEISEALAAGNRVELRGFGAFSVKHRDARVGRNPRTGESVDVSEKRIPFFKTGKQLRERLERLEKEVQGMPEPLTKEWVDVPGVFGLSARCNDGFLEFRYFSGKYPESRINWDEVPALIMFLKKFNTQIAEEK